MKKLLLPIAAAGAAIALPTAAQAAPFLMVTGAGGSFGDDSLTCTGAAPCTFSDTLNFATPAGFNLASLTLGSSEVGTDTTTDVSFSTVTLNGVSFNPVLTGYTEFYNLLNQAITNGATNTLVISGTTGGRGSFGGSISFATVSAVPEPAVWSMLVLGFGVAGYALRRRQATFATAR